MNDLQHFGGAWECDPLLMYNADYYPHWLAIIPLSILPAYVMQAKAGAYDAIGEKFERNWNQYHLAYAERGTEMKHVAV